MTYDSVLTHLLQIELKYKHKYRLILDEGFSFGTVGRTGRGLTELYNVPVRNFPFLRASVDIDEAVLSQASKIDMLVGSLATGLCAGGGFCAGSQVVVDHQVCR